MQLPSSVATLRPMHTFHPALQLFPSGLSGPRLEEVRFVEMVGGSGNAALGLLRDCPKLHSLAVAGPQSMMGEREQGRTKLAAPGGPTGAGSGWILVADDAETVAPLVDVLDAGGHRHRIVGLPASAR